MSRIATVTLTIAAIGGFAIHHLPKLFNKRQSHGLMTYQYIGAVNG